MKSSEIIFTQYFTEYKGLKTFVANIYQRGSVIVEERELRNLRIRERKSFKKVAEKVERDRLLEIVKEANTTPPRYKRLTLEELKERKLKRRFDYYGTTKEFIFTLLSKQKSGCAICKKSLTIEIAYIDHDHKTQEIRGVLCAKCNGFLGRHGDTKESIKEYSQYVKRALRYLSG